MESPKEVIEAVEAEVSKVESEVKTEVVDPVKAGILAQKQNFIAQLEGVKKDMLKLQQDFEAKKTLGIRLEGALESLEMLLRSTTTPPATPAAK
ncbi:MAG: hypothetical protein ACREBR_05710 [bacterium]